MTMFIDMTLIFFKETGTFYYFLPFFAEYLYLSDCRGQKKNVRFSQLP